MNEDDKVISQIDRLIQKAEEVKSTYRRNPPGVIGFPTLDHGTFMEWKNSLESLVVRVTGIESVYYKNLKQEVKEGFSSDVDAGVGLLRALRQDVQEGIFSKQSELGFSKLIHELFDSFVAWIRENKIISGVIVGVIVTLSAALLKGWLGI